MQYSVHCTIYILQEYDLTSESPIPGSSALSSSTAVALSGGILADTPNDDTGAWVLPKGIEAGTL